MIIKKLFASTEEDRLLAATHVRNSARLHPLPPDSLAVPLHPAARILHRICTRAEAAIQKGKPRSKVIWELSRRYYFRKHQGHKLGASFGRLNVQFSAWRRRGRSPRAFTWNFHRKPSRINEEMLCELQQILRRNEVLSFRQAHEMLRRKRAGIPGYSTFCRQFNQQERMSLQNMFKARRQARMHLQKLFKPHRQARREAGR